MVDPRLVTAVCLIIIALVVGFVIYLQSGGSF